MSQVDFSQQLESPLFKDLSNKDIESLGSIFTCSQVAEGKTVFIENMPGEALYLIEQGTVQISQMIAEVDEQKLTTLGAGDIFGEMSVIDGESRLVTARITTDATLYSLSRKNFTKLTSENPRLGQQLTLNIARIFSAKIRSAKKDYRTMLTASLPHRN